MKRLSFISLLLLAAVGCNRSTDFRPFSAAVIAEYEDTQDVRPVSNKLLLDALVRPAVILSVEARPSDTGISFRIVRNQRNWTISRIRRRGCKA